MKKFLCSALAATLPFSSLVIAAPFNSLDARAMAMGDVGVAASQPGSAPIFNAALMSQNASDETVSIILPNVGVSIFADENALESFGNIVDEEYLGSIADSVDNFNSAGTDINAAQQAATDLGEATKGLNSELSNLSEKPFNINVGGLFSVVVPTELIGIGIYANAQAVVETAPVITECDTKLFDDYAEIALSVGNANIAPSTPIPDPVKTTSVCNGDTRVIYDITKSEFVDPVAEKFDTNGNPTVSEQSYLTSHVEIAGVTISEFGIALSHKFKVNDSDFSLSITPKMQNITSYYALPSIEDLDNEDYDIGDELEGSEKTDTAFNFDLGFAMGFLQDDALILGFTVKNILGQTYKTKTIGIDRNNDGTTEKYTGEFDLNPQARAGIAWDLPLGLTLASDLDLTTNKALFSGQDTQYFGLGAEWDVFNILRLRAGARANLENSDDMALTAGLGFNIIAFHIDLAGQFSDNNAGVAVQMGIEF